MPFYILKGDLVNMDVDIIVNASNINLAMVEGVGRAIFHKAGDQLMAQACRDIGHCEVGDVAVTPSFGITNTKMIVHAVAPIYFNGKHREDKLLESAYLKSLKVLNDNNLHSIAFPLLSGEFNYPLSEAYEIAKKTFLKYLKTHKDDEIYLVLFKNFPLMINDSFHYELSHYITSNYKKSDNVDVKIADSNKKFMDLIRGYQQKAKLTDANLIFKSNLSSRLFKLLITDEKYIPSKNTILSLGIALKLSLNEIEKLLNSVGYSFDVSSILDLIVIFYLKNKIYDVYQINDALFNYSIFPLGAG